ncbi:MAG: hypothetical protein QXH27_03555 [Candidatus Micrarchaeia archaeon]
MKLDFGVSLLVVFALAFASVFLVTPVLARKIAAAGFLAPDLNKRGRPRVPKIGGVAVILGFCLAALLSLQLSTQLLNIPIMLASIATVLLISLLGLLDDILRIRDVWRVVLPAFAALPLMVVKAGTSMITIPLIGPVQTDLGVVVLPLLGPVNLNLYVLLLIPVGVVASSNLINLLAGFNGLEAGSGAIVSASLLATLLLLPANPGTAAAGFLLAALLGACLAFLVFNWFPAKVFPGNALTYAIGAVIVAAVVSANFERAGVIALTPQIIEFFLKARSRFQAENFGTPDRAGRLRYGGKICSLTHLAMRLLRPTEPQLVAILLLVQALFGALAVASVLL